MTMLKTVELKTNRVNLLGLINELMQNHTIRCTVGAMKLTYTINLKHHELRNKDKNGVWVYGFDGYCNQEVRFKLSDIQNIEILD